MRRSDARGAVLHARRLSIEGVLVKKEPNHSWQCARLRNELWVGWCDKVRVKRPQERKQHAPRRTRETRCQQGATQDPPPDRHAIVFCLRCLVGRVGQPGRGRARVAQRVFRRASQGPQGRACSTPPGGARQDLTVGYVLQSAAPVELRSSPWLYRGVSSIIRSPYTVHLCLRVRGPASRNCVVSRVV
jgi:hypothetical protein